MKTHHSMRAILEQATADGDQMPAAIDAEASSLRESWLALGELLEDAQFASNDRNVVRCVGGFPMRVRRRQNTGQRRGSFKKLALAAVVMIAAYATIAYRATNRSPDPDHEPAIVEADIHWDDSLDDTIHSVSERTVTMQVSWCSQSSHLNTIAHGLSQLEQDIQDSTL